MKVLFDTSVLISALVVSLPTHKIALEWLEKVQQKEVIGFVSAHGIAELYAFLSGPGKKRPADVQVVIQKEILPYVQVVALTEQEYLSMIEEVVKLRLSGAVVYDAIHVHVARKIEADLILTGNGKDFTRVCPIPPPEIRIISIL